MSEMSWLCTGFYFIYFGTPSPHPTPTLIGLIFKGQPLFNSSQLLLHQEWWDGVARNLAFQEQSEIPRVSIGFLTACRFRRIAGINKQRTVLCLEGRLCSVPGWPNFSTLVTSTVLEVVLSGASHTGATPSWLNIMKVMSHPVISPGWISSSLCGIWTFRWNSELIGSDSASVNTQKAQTERELSQGNGRAVE